MTVLVLGGTSESSQRGYSDLATQLVTAGHQLTMLKEEEINLETAFLELTRSQSRPEHTSWPTAKRSMSFGRQECPRSS